MWFLNRSLIGRPAPVVSGEKWFNITSLPISARQKVQAGKEISVGEDFAGKVLLIDFWDYSCINCVNTLPYVRQWWERYRSYGFIVIGVHTPEFEFAKDPDKVQSALLRFSLSYPVVSDPQYETWKRYQNHVWPRELLVDSAGIIRYDHQGEGNYQVTEKKIQDLLHVLHPEAVFDNPLTALRETDVPGAVCYPTTPEIYLGYKRGRAANAAGLVVDREAMYEAPTHLSVHRWGVQGVWLAKAESIQSMDGGDVASSLLLRYEASEVFAVMGTMKGMTGRVEVRQDDMPLTPETCGQDVRVISGRSYVSVTQDRLYYLVKNRKHGQYQLELIPEAGGIVFHTFTFGSSCKK